MLPYYQDPYIVLLSVCVAIIGCLTGLATVWSFQKSPGEDHSLAPVYRGAAIIGGTVWSMHFIAMNAVQAPIPISYELVTTALSLILAILVTAAGLYLANSSGNGFLNIVSGGTVMGLGIAGMHYLGMAAIRGCSVQYATKGVVLSVLIGITASAVALIFSLRRRSLIVTMFGSVILGVAICSLHYTAMAATSFYPPVSASSYGVTIVDAGMLAYVVVGVAGLTYSIVLAAMAEGKL